jgi:hypothetical protein
MVCQNQVGLSLVLAVPFARTQRAITNQRDTPPRVSGAIEAKRLSTERQNNNSIKERRQ